MDHSRGYCTSDVHHLCLDGRMRTQLPGRWPYLRFRILPPRNKDSLSLSFFMDAPMAYGNAWARDWTWAAAVTYAATVAMPDPLTHWTGPGIQLAPLQWQCLILNLLSHARTPQMVFYLENDRCSFHKSLAMFKLQDLVIWLKKSSSPNCSHLDLEFCPLKCRCCLAEMKSQLNDYFPVDIDQFC